MYYLQSTRILEEIKKANNILINVHVGPDLDTVGSAMAMYSVLKKFGKRISLVCPSKLEENFLLLPETTLIKTIDFGKYKFDSFDLFVILDSMTYDRVTGSKQIQLPQNITKVIVDHHKRNPLRGVVEILDEEASATCEIMFKIFKDWGIQIDKTTATFLLAGIIGDTVFFKYVKDAATFEAVSELLKLGADQDLIVKNIYNNFDFNFAQCIGKFLNQMHFNKKEKFVWAALSYEEYVKYGMPRGAREAAADQFFQSIKGANFGIAMLEFEKGKVSVSLRSKKGFDISKLAEELGGGGHEQAAGATVHGSFEDAVTKVVETARTYLP